MLNIQLSERVRLFFMVAPACLMFAAAGCGGSGTGGLGVVGPPGYAAAQGIPGGKAYDKFWATEVGWDQDDPNIAIFNAKPDFFRCKQCHGWDLLGNAGSYINRGPNTNRPRVAAGNLLAIAAAMTPQQLFDAIKRSTNRRPINADLSTYHPVNNPTVGDQMPDYGSIFTDARIWIIVKFLKTEAIDTSQLYDSVTQGAYPTGTIAYSNIGKNGNAANGDAIFAAKCASCHGADGRAFLVDGGAYTVGRHLRAKPYEDQHKIKFGQLGSEMSSRVQDLAQMRDLYKALADPAKYPD